MRFLLIAGAAFSLAGAAYGVGSAQTDRDASKSGAADQGVSDRRAALRKACQADIEKLCSGLQPGGGRIFQCMREHRDDLSDGCKAALSSMRGGQGGYRSQ